MVRVLAVADREDRLLYEHFNRERWAREGVELIVACGDLKPGYLDFLVSMFNVPLFYVRGNHDVTYDKADLGGCTNLHGRVEHFRGVRFFGLEGSRWYNGGPAQYTERQMARQIARSRFALWLARGVDVIVSHAPPRLCPLTDERCLCIHPPPDGTPTPVGQPCYVDPERSNWELADLPHRGFATFHQFAVQQQPRAWLHGHTHLGYGLRPRELALGCTRVIDAYGYVLLDV